MKQVLLDTNFILSCIKQKIDFFEYLELEGYEILIPEKVSAELKKLKKEFALNLLEKESKNFKKIFLTGKTVDKSIVRYAKENPKLIIATLDREIQKKIRNKKMIIRNKKKLEIV
jgi:rRNA-processing protein FCF1